MRNNFLDTSQLNSVFLLVFRSNPSSCNTVLFLD
jgi:hypothetical protein